MAEGFDWELSERLYREGLAKIKKDVATMEEDVKELEDQETMADFAGKVKRLNEEVSILEQQSLMRMEMQGPLSESMYEWSITAVETFLKERKDRSASVLKTDQKKRVVSSCYNLIICKISLIVSATAPCGAPESVGRVSIQLQYHDAVAEQTAKAADKGGEKKCEKVETYRREHCN